MQSKRHDSMKLALHVISLTFERLNDENLPQVSQKWHALQTHVGKHIYVLLYMLQWKDLWSTQSIQKISVQRIKIYSAFRSLRKCFKRERLVFISSFYFLTSYYIFILLFYFIFYMKYYFFSEKKKKNHKKLYVRAKFAGLCNRGEL